MGNSFKSVHFLMESRLVDAARGNADALFDLGVAYSSGSGGVEVDLIAAHKWFNLAALNGSEAATMCRADISDEMTAREIAEAQRQARAWLQATDQRRAA
jgi:TPR repeat protein